MSAIFGLIHNDGSVPLRKDLEHMSTVLAAHGPNGEGFWLKNNVGLGQRLMHFTPEDRFEKQPLLSPDGQKVIISDGRIDNRSELIEELKISPIEAQTLPDSLFVLRAYERWGEECTCHLIGSFAFAVWNTKDQSLFMACSRTEPKPIFYYSTPKIFIFSTMPKALFSFPFVKREVDLHHFGDFLIKGYYDLGSTFYKSIHLLPHEHSLKFKNGSFKIRRYWQLNVKQELRLKNNEEYVLAFNEIFKRAVSDRLRSISPIGISMSGGLDSSSIAVTAATLLKQKRKSLSTFTEVPPPTFDGSSFKSYYADETPFVQAIGKMYDTMHLNFVRTDKKFFLEGIDNFFETCEMPFINGSNRI